MKNPKILNLCSAIGNIGDDASHVGLKRILATTLSSFSIQKLDIRNFYASEPTQSRRFFDEELASYINQFDLCIVGGGAFLDYPIIDSLNGPTIDFTDAFLDEIRSKVLIASVSCRPKGVSEEADEKVLAYFQKLNSHPNVDILFRNDGSVEHLKSLGIKSDEVKQILDNGFFLQREDLITEQQQQTPYYCCLNVVNDQLSFYGNNKLFTADFYYDYIAELVKKLHLYGFERIVLVPHIYQDLHAIYEVLKRVNRRLISEKIIVNELIQGELAAMKTFGIYSRSALNLGTRFHTNVCSFALDRPTIPIPVTGRLKALSENFDINYDFGEILDDFEKIFESSKGENKNKVKNILVKQKKNTLEHYKCSLSEFL